MEAAIPKFVPGAMVRSNITILIVFQGGLKSSIVELNSVIDLRKTRVIPVIAPLIIIGMVIKTNTLRGFEPRLSAASSKAGCTWYSVASEVFTAKGNLRRKYERVKINHVPVKTIGSSLKTRIKPIANTVPGIIKGIITKVLRIKLIIL